MQQCHEDSLDLHGTLTVSRLFCGFLNSSGTINMSPIYRSGWQTSTVPLCSTGYHRPRHLSLVGLQTRDGGGMDWGLLSWYYCPFHRVFWASFGLTKVRGEWERMNDSEVSQSQLLFLRCCKRKVTFWVSTTGSQEAAWSHWWRDAPRIGDSDIPSLDVHFLEVHCGASYCYFFYKYVVLSIP